MGNLLDELTFREKLGYLSVKLEDKLKEVWHNSFTEAIGSEV